MTTSLLGFSSIAKQLETTLQEQKEVCNIKIIHESIDLIFKLELAFTKFLLAFFGEMFETLAYLHNSQFCNLGIAIVIALNLVI